ncbi:MAG TPA: 23S rRNA (adenine(2503)-C(2))-methyltransferase RlmN [Thermoanaerobaculia bacterium]|nr:23S rRNA (adenine(2503)-C(2))-methyltransferase RlmN [Thermoanaerobaculia bacterium]
MSDEFAAWAWSRAEWEGRAEELGQPRYRGRQIFDAIHARRATAYGEMTELSRKDRDLWTGAAPLVLPEIARRDVSTDGSVKYGLRFPDGALVEAVFMPRGEEEASAESEFEDARASAAAGGGPTMPADPARATICLSSQTGCAVDCRFCVTGRLGAGRNLSAGEIVAQFLAVAREHPATTFAIVFMGMGEPMLNLEAVEAALDVFFETISPRRITVSTSGFPEGIRRLGARAKQPNLAVSINAADQKTREKIMPVSRAHPLAEVVAAMRAFPLTHRRRITAEYVLLAGVNDSIEDARNLARLLRGIPVKINVIPFNPDPRYLPEFRRPSEETVERFVDALARERYTVTVRRSKGPDASAACGQLKGREVDARSRSGAPVR